MMRVLVILCLVFPILAVAQTREVLPGELSLTIEIEDGASERLVGEMVLVTIRGTYRRHITRESLKQPELDGFSWSQLGQDMWTEARIRGQKVKVFTRRMALFPERAGTLAIGAFTHNLTLTDEGDDWFEHAALSQPIEIEVKLAPEVEGVWFPVKRLVVTDQWSNAPDQLAPGEAVLRVIRVEALGVTPEMIPPMPELTSPSAMIFPHPEQRLAELTPEGPVSYAFWRWTIRPTNDVSTIVEPISFPYFDTETRQSLEAVISPQRIAYGVKVPSGPPPAVVPVQEARLPGWPVASAAALIFLGGLSVGLRGRTVTANEVLRRVPSIDPLARRLVKAARKGDGREARRMAARMIERDGPSIARQDLIAVLDRSLFDPAGTSPDLAWFSRTFLSAAR